MIDLRQGDCLEVLKTIPNESIDLVITSPPYDNLRNYNNRLNWNFEVFKNIVQELYRVLKKGGVIVWVVNDKTQKGSESGTSFKQALYFKELGLNLHDTMIWFKPNAMPQVDKTRYTQSFEYMFVFSKGKPKTTNLQTIPTKYGGKYLARGDGNIENINKKGGNVVKKERVAFNVFNVCVGGSNYGHPAVFPLEIPKLHIATWSNENDTILDCFMGSGTTGVICKELNRNFIGIELDEKYFEIAKKRIEETKPEEEQPQTTIFDYI